MKIVSSRLFSCLIMLGVVSTAFAHHDDDKFKLSFNLSQDGRVSISDDHEERRHHRHFRQQEWVDMRQGDGVPADAVVGGKQYLPSYTFYICRADYNGGTHPGKLIGGKCNISWGGSEVSLHRYQVLVSRVPVDWVPANFGMTPPNAIPGGFEHGHTLFICQAKHRDGVYPGKIVGQNCNIGWNGQEIMKQNYRVLVS